MENKSAVSNTPAPQDAAQDDSSTIATHYEGQLNGIYNEIDKRESVVLSKHVWYRPIEFGTYSCQWCNEMFKPMGGSGGWWFECGAQQPICGACLAECLANEEGKNLKEALNG
jgi:hypothetical protein